MTDGLSARASLNGAPTVGVSARQGLVTEIRTRIMNGEYQPGQQLKQDEIGLEFSVSVAPVREALRQLESEGLVEHKTNRGVFVLDVSKDELFGVLLPIRLTLEIYAAHKMLPALTRDRRRQLADLVDRMRRLAADGDVRGINETDIRFHELTIIWADQPHTAQLWWSVLPRIRSQMYRLAPRHDDLAEIAEEHAVLLDRLQSGDRDDIDHAIEDHIIGTTHRLLRDEMVKPSANRRAANST